MRSGKRWLAGVAAGALGAGLMVGLGTTSANAVALNDTPVRFTVDYPSYTILTDGLESASFSLPIRAYNAAGKEIDGAYTGNRQIRLQITNPLTVPSSLTPIALNCDASCVPDGKAQIIATGGAASSLTFDDSDYPTWAAMGSSTVSATGTYTVAIALVNTSNGAVVQGQAVPITVVTSASAPAATVNFLNDDSNVITGLGVGALSDAQDQAILLTDSRGGPYVGLSGPIPPPGTADDTGSLAITATSGGALKWVDDSTLGTDFQVDYPGQHILLPGDDTAGRWGLPGRGFISVTVKSPQSGTSSATRGSGQLPVGIGAVAPAFDISLLNEVSYQTDDIGDVPVYEVPVGTSELKFGLDSTVDLMGQTSTWWNADALLNPESMQSSGGITNLSGGAAPIDASGNGTISFKVDETGSAEGNWITVATGENPGLVGSTISRAYVVFAKPRPDLVGDTALGKVSSEVDLPGTITTQFGEVIPGTWTVTAQPIDGTCFTASTQIAVATADADGAFTLKIPASAAATVASTKDFLLCATNGVTTIGTNSVARGASIAQVIYTATGGVNSLDLQASVPNIPVVGLPTNGFVDLTGGGLDTANTVTDPAKADVNDGCPEFEIMPLVTSRILNGCTATNLFHVSAVTSPVVAVTVTVPEGAWITTRNSGSLVWSAGKKSVTLSGNGIAEAVVYATKPGTYDVTATVGTSTDTVKFVADVFYFATRQVNVNEPTADMGTLQTREFGATLTDVYGNPVPGGVAAVDSQGALDVGSFPFLEADAKGVVKSFFTSFSVQGEGLAQFNTLTGGRVSGTVAPGLAAAVNLSTTKVMVGATANKTILIKGGRTTKGGKPVVEVDGKTTGFKVGDTVKPYVRFPGQGSYNEGTARPKIDAGDNFYWSRKTGKKTYVYFTNDDGQIRSNTVIIPAK